MAEKLVPSIAKLSPEMKARLTKMEGEIEGAEKAIGVIKSLGLDVTPLEEKISWARDVRKALLTEFSE